MMRAEAAGRGLIHAAIKNQLHLTGPTDVEILADYFLEEHAAVTGRSGT